MKALGEAALDLPWIVPSATSLAALTRPDAAKVWAEIRHDPGCVLLLCRAESDHTSASSFREHVHDPEPLEHALALLEANAPFVDWNQPGPAEVYRACIRQARLALALAQNVGRSDPEQAWVAGLLAPLGWLAIVSVEKPAGLHCLAAPSEGWQTQAWGIDHASLTRRLCRAWRLPHWLSSVIGNLGLQVRVAEQLGADRVLFAIVSLAVSLLEAHDAGLDLVLGTPAAQLAEGLNLSAESISTLVQQVIESPPLLNAWHAPAAQPLLADLLRVALCQRKRSETAWMNRLQDECDLLHLALTQQGYSEEHRLQELKLKALAELAAGAGHEINNPLAVISGQAQYLLRRLEQAEANLSEETTALELLEDVKATLPKPLRTIIGQTQRIHQVLTELMQFARPGATRVQLIPLEPLLQEVAALHQEAARLKKVRVTFEPLEEGLLISADLNQARTILASLVRNAIDAAPPEGWIGIRVEDSGPSAGCDAIHALVRILVEDNGPGPAPEIREHLFDPFFSGRSAGRGRGLGLSTAWRLARHNGGDVAYDPSAGVTRFVLTLPRAATPPSLLPESKLHSEHSAEANGHAGPVRNPALP